MNELHLDYETYSEANLLKIGGYAYAAHPTTKITLCSFAYNDFPVELWDATDPNTPEPPLMLLKWLNDPNVELHAFNANFERLITEHCLKRRLPISRFHCTMVHAWSLSFSGGLDAIGKQLGLAQEHQKLSDGKKLIQKFCKPAPKNHLADRYDRNNAPEAWERFKEYCIQDTDTERRISQLLGGYPVHPTERALWIMDQKINDRGIPIDLPVVHGAVKIYHAEKEKLKLEMNLVTGLANANSTQQLLLWFANEGLKLEDMTKDTVAAALSKAEPSSVVHRVLELRQKVSKTSPAKWEALARATTEDGRLRGTFAFGGAQRTQRWAGRIFQPHNLPRPSRNDTDVTAGILSTGDRDIVEMLYGDVMQFLVDNIRSAVTAPKGQLLVASDLSSIESRVVGWATGCTRVNQIFAEGKDTYKDFATEVYHIGYDEVTEQQRHFSKPAVLGSCFGLGAKGLMAYAEGYGITMGKDESQRITDIYREMYPEIPAAWRWLTDNFIAVIEHRILEANGCGVRIFRDTNFLFMELPSGRRIAYYQPRVEMKVPPWEQTKVGEADALGEVYVPKTIPNVTYMGMDQYTRKWGRQSTHGGKILENVAQAIARDILAQQMLEVENDHPEMSIVLHVHDEMGVLVGKGIADESLTKLEAIMSVTPEWAPGLLLGAAGFVTSRYKKD